MWVILLCFCLQGIASVQSLDMDASLRSRLGHFSTTRNNYVKPEEKTKARDYIVKTFKDFGLDTWTEEFPSNQAAYPGINVVGRVNGRNTGTSKDKILIVGSHYDTAKTTNGVDDNGSGISALLQALAKYKNTNNANCTQDYTLLFVAFDLEERQGCSANQSSCSCPRGLCGSGYFVKNLTRHLNGTGTTVQGAFVLETIMNFNTTPNTQSLPSVVQTYFPTEYGLIQKNQFKGDFLAVIGRKTDDNELMSQLVSNFDQGRFKAMKIPLPFSGKTTALNIMMQRAISHFLRSDHTRFWNGEHSWPAVFITDTADFRGFMRSCYHEMCDSMDSVTPDMITFMGKTTDAIVGAAQTMAGRVCPKVTYCTNATLITTNEQSISSPLYPSHYANDVSCGWIRESEYPQKLVFESFDLENSTNCMNDYLEVIAGDKTVGRYCGSSKPNTITTSEKKLRVRFVSDAFVSRKGFKITWSTNAPTTAPTAPISVYSGSHLCIASFQSMVIAFTIILLDYDSLPFSELYS